MRTLLEDVENVRRAKMYEGMGSAAQEVQQAVKVKTLQFPCYCSNVSELIRSGEMRSLNNGDIFWPPVRP